MEQLTTQQKRFLNFIQSHQRSEGIVPPLRKIARHFGFRSMTAAADHVRALRRKKVLAESDRRARPLKVISPLDAFCKQGVGGPAFGPVPAGYAHEQAPEAIGRIPMDLKTIRLR